VRARVYYLAAVCPQARRERANSIPTSALSRPHSASRAAVFAPHGWSACTGLASLPFASYKVLHERREIADPSQTWWRSQSIVDESRDTRASGARMTGRLLPGGVTSVAVWESNIDRLALDDARLKAPFRYRSHESVELALASRGSTTRAFWRPALRCCSQIPGRSVHEVHPPPPRS